MPLVILYAKEVTLIEYNIRNTFVHYSELNKLCYILILRIK